MGSETKNGRRVLWVLSGGGMPGLDIHAGLIHALASARGYPTEISGTSAGAIIGGLLAAGLNDRFVRELIHGLEDRDVRDEIPLWRTRGTLLRKIACLSVDHFLRHDPILKVLRRNLPPNYENYGTRFSAWSTLAETAHQVNVFRPDIFSDPRRAILSSMSISGVFDQVMADNGSDYYDGGVGFNVPVPSNWDDFDEVWILIATGAPGSYRDDTGLITALMRNVEWMIQAQMHKAILGCAAGIESGKVRVLWPQLDTPRGTFRFDHELQFRAYMYAKIQIEQADFAARPEVAK